MMGIDILHHMRVAYHLNVDTQFFFEFAYEGSPPVFTKLDTTTEWANPFQAAVIIKDLCC